jgi:hypothetical protein
VIFRVIRNYLTALELGLTLPALHGEGGLPSRAAPNDFGGSLDH